MSEHPDLQPAPTCVADRLHSAAIHLLRRFRKQDVATGEGPARLSALSVLVFGGPKTLGELAAAEQVKPPTMSRMVAGLARSRLMSDHRRPSGCPPDADPRHRKGNAPFLQKGRQLRIAYLAAHLDRLSAARARQSRKGCGNSEQVAPEMGLNFVSLVT